MTTFDKREEGFEKRFAIDEELRFKAHARRARLLGLWTAARLGITGEAADDYAMSVVKADFQEAGDEDIFRKVKADLEAAGKPAPDAEIRTAMMDLLGKAIEQIKADL